MCNKTKSRRETKVFRFEEISIFLNEAQQTVIQIENVCGYLKKGVERNVTPKLQLTMTSCLPSILQILILKMW